MIEISPDNISKIVSYLKEGKVVALPTETVYGLAIALNSATALEKLIYLKRRDIHSGKVFTLVPPSREDFPTYATLNKNTSAFVHTYIPGEVTVILPRNPEFSHPYFNHFANIGLRIPKHPLFTQILPLTGPLLLTSANPRGGTPAITSDDVKNILPKVDVVVTGTSGNHAPSTIIDYTDKNPTVIRQGNLKI